MQKPQSLQQRLEQARRQFEDAPFEAPAPQPRAQQAEAPHVQAATASRAFTALSGTARFFGHQLATLPSLAVIGMLGAHHVPVIKISADKLPAIQKNLGRDWLAVGACRLAPESWRNTAIRWTSPGSEVMANTLCTFAQNTSYSAIRDLTSAAQTAVADGKLTGAEVGNLRWIAHQHTMSLDCAAFVPELNALPEKTPQSAKGKAIAKYVAGCTPLTEALRTLYAPTEAKPTSPTR